VSPVSCSSVAIIPLTPVPVGALPGSARLTCSTSIFFPSTWDQTSPQTLPCYFSIHGGGFCLGNPDDDDQWNRAFADAHDVLVVELNYRKAPAYPFPVAIHDVEALMLAVYGDESLPIDKRRIAVGGFSAGGNLTLAVCQLPAIRNRIRPSAACPIYPLVDQAANAEEKAKKRYYKPGLGPGLRGNPTDMLSPLSSLFRWSYIPYGVNLKDPLLSPFFAPRDSLPKNIFIVAAELDRLAHDSWRLASMLANRPEPSPDVRVGQEKPSARPGELILDDERFSFEHVGDDGRGVRWLLIPDQIHGFDVEPVGFHGNEEAFQDAQVKAKAYRKILGEWLHKSVWA
jgi:acetyl esterase/lipase